MKRALIIIFALVVGLPSVSYGQIEKQVEVTKTFIPKVESATKLGISPDMSDTVRIRPDINYTVTPLAIKTELATRPIKPATVTYWEFNRPQPFYLKVGGGYPSNSVVDFYASSQHPSTGYVVGYVNHQGRYGNIENDFGIDSRATQLNNNIGGVVGKYLGGRVLELKANYKNRYDRRYGASSSTFEPSADFPLANSYLGRNINYGVLDGQIRYGDDFVDLDRFNFNIALRGSMLFDNSDYQIAGDSRQTDWGASAAVARSFGRHEFMLHTTFDVSRGDGAIEDYSRNTFMAGLSYAIRGNLFDIEVGADVYHEDFVDHKDESYFLPQLKISMRLGDRALVPFISLDSELRDNSYKSLLEQNPYVATPDFMLRSSRDYNFRFGIEGLVDNSRLSYRFDIGISPMFDRIFWYGVLDSSADAPFGLFNGSFQPSYGGLDIYSFNGELIYKPIQNLEITFGAHGYMYNDFNQSVGGIGNLESGEPAFRADASVRYNVGDFSFGLGAEAVGERKWNMILVGGVDQQRETTLFIAPTCIDVNFDVNYRLNSGLELFGEVRNIANAKLYNNPYYREYGINFTVGVKVNF